MPEFLKEPRANNDVKKIRKTEFTPKLNLKDDSNVPIICISFLFLNTFSQWHGILHKKSF